MSADRSRWFEAMGPGQRQAPGLLPPPAAVYGEPPQSPIPEDSPPSPLSVPYGHSKAIVERVLHRS